MSEAPRYPQNNEVNVEWKPLHIAIVVLSVLVIWPLFYCATDLTKNLTNKLLSVGGLNIDIIGVVVASLKTPFYGYFHDGGKIEITRANVEKRYFQRVGCISEASYTKLGELSCTRNLSASL